MEKITKNVETSLLNIGIDVNQYQTISEVVEVLTVKYNEFIKKENQPIKRNVLHKMLGIENADYLFDNIINTK